MRFVAIENVRSNTAGTGIYGCKRDIPAVAEVPQMALLCGLWHSENVRSNTAGMECTVSDEVFVLLTKCRKRLCYAVCGNRRM